MNKMVSIIAVQRFCSATNMDLLGMQGSHISGLLLDAKAIDIASFIMDVIIGIFACVLTVIQMKRDRKDAKREERQQIEEKNREELIKRNVTELHTKLSVLCDNIYIDDYKFSGSVIYFCTIDIELIDNYLKKAKTEYSEESISKDFRYLRNPYEYVETFVAWYYNLSILGDILLKYEDYLPESSAYFVHILEKMSWDTNLAAVNRHCSSWLSEVRRNNYNKKSAHVIIGSLNCIRSIVLNNFYECYENYKFAIQNLEKKLSSTYNFDSRCLDIEFNEIKAHFVTQEEYDTMISDEIRSLNRVLVYEDNEDVREELFQSNRRTMKQLEEHFYHRIKREA